MPSYRMSDYRTGAELLAAFNCKTREARLEQAVKALMQNLTDIHYEHHRIKLDERIDDRDVACSCMDAYRMGHEALKNV
jgi:hypothetical protein